MMVLFMAWISGLPNFIMQVMCDFILICLSPDITICGWLGSKHQLTTKILICQKLKKGKNIQPIHLEALN